MSSSSIYEEMRKRIEELGDKILPIILVDNNEKVVGVVTAPQDLKRGLLGEAVMNVTVEVYAAVVDYVNKSTPDELANSPLTRIEVRAYPNWAIQEMYAQELVNATLKRPIKRFNFDTKEHMGEI